MLLPLRFPAAIDVPVHKWWLGHRLRADIYAADFFPGKEAYYEEDGQVYLNYWPGFPHDAGPGLWKSLGELGDLAPHLQHLKYGWCRGCQASFDWVVGFFADLRQNPARKAGVCLVLQSIREGAGKGLPVTQMGKHTVGEAQFVAVNGYSLSLIHI